jgi:hypothetical protein
LRAGVTLPMHGTTRKFTLHPKSADRKSLFIANDPWGPARHLTARTTILDRAYRVTNTG